MDKGRDQDDFLRRPAGRVSRGMTGPENSWWASRARLRVDWWGPDSVWTGGGLEGEGKERNYPI